jgi:hypothetical protein
VGDSVFVALDGAGANCPPGKGGKGLVTLKIRVDPAPAIETVWCATVPNHKSSPIVATTDGHANPIVFIVGADRDDSLYAFRGDSGELLASAAQPRRGFDRYQTPIAAGDRIYVVSGGQVYAFTF